MRIKSRYKADADLYEYTGNNMLYDLVELYGAYIEYIHKIDEDSFIAFYNNTKERVLYRYINLANNEVKNYLLKKKIIVSSRKLKRIIITGEKSFVYSYEWMPLYVEYIINKIFQNDVLTKYVREYILNDCECLEDCYDMDSKQMRVLICKKVLLGFQFDFLEIVKDSYSGRKARVAEKILNGINTDVNKVVDSCPNK